MPEGNSIGDPISAYTIFSMNITRDFSCSKKSRNGLIVFIEHLGLFINGNTTHRRMNGHEDWGGPEGAMGEGNTMVSSTLFRSILRGSIKIFDRFLKGICRDIDSFR